MRYYVVSDIHGFYDEFIEAISEKGYFNDKKEHKLIICGDLFDRGKQALELQNFIEELLYKDEVILIKGNHEDLLLDLLEDWQNYSYEKNHHIHNGTVDTVLQLTKASKQELYFAPKDIIKRFVLTPTITTIVPKMKDYFESNDYIFVHGWIPCTILRHYSFYEQYIYNDNWRSADEYSWNNARWLNGMLLAHKGIIEQDKTIICGHWHCSFGHAHYENKADEFGTDADFSPYYDKGIIAIDGCTALTGKVNCIVLED